MAVILDPVVSHFMERLITVVENEVKMLLGVHGEIRALRGRLSSLQAHLGHAERGQLQGEPIRTWLRDLREAVYEADDILDEYLIKTESLQQQGLPPSSNLLARFVYPFHSCLSPFTLHDFGNRIKKLNGKLAAIDERKLDPGRASENRRDGSQNAVREAESEAVGTAIDSDARMLVKLLLKASDKNDVLVYAIVGMGGIGKTTLAWKIFSHEMIQTSFSEIRPAWVDLSNDHDRETVLKKIIMDFKGDLGEIQNSHNLKSKLSQLVTKKKFFLVLDDVRKIEVWDELLKPLLKNASRGSRVLVTTRDRAISRCMDAERCHEVQKLSPEDGWSLLCKKVFPGGDEIRKQNLETIGMRIVDKCDGLPLALKTIGRELRGRDSIQAEWERFARDSSWSFEEPEEMGGIGKQVMGALYPSYESLEFSQLKQCFVYCAMFPKDYILRQDMLVPLWIAEGFIKASKDSLMEDTAEEYWKKLVQLSLMQVDLGYYNQGGCKMHHVVHSLALYLAQGECFSGDVQGLVSQTASTSSSPKRRRMLIRDEKGVSNFDVIVESRWLRTIIFLDTPLLRQVPEDFHKKFPLLRVLDLSGAPNSKLPDAVQHLMHLRYLNLSRSKITEIPDTIGRLRNLQFLGLAECKSLRILSEAIIELHNLRALDVHGTQLEGMPKGIGTLQHLNRLVGFRVGSSTNNADRSGAEGGEGRDGWQRSPGSWCTLKELKNLTQLKFLMIQNLERISIIREAERAELSSKSRLDDLRLICNLGRQAITDEKKRTIKEVFDKLRPRSRLQRLEVGGYFGLEYPDWMMGGSISSHLRDLKHLELRDCFFCQTLPPLGLLPNLEILHISGAAAVKSIKNNFLLGDAVAAGQAQHRFCAFPKLKQLVLKNMDSWKTWLWEKEEVEDPAIVDLLPLLEELVIERCNKLTSLPEALLHNVTRLTIEHANSLREIGSLPSVRTLKIAGRNLVRIYNLRSLENLTIVGCYELREMNIGRLQYLKFEDQTMISLPNWLKNEKEVKEPLQSLTSEASKSLFASGQDFVAVRKLEFICETWLLQRCIKGGPEWPKIQDIPHVKGYNMDKSRYISYDKGLKFDTNIKEEEITSERTADSSISIKRTTNSSSDITFPFSIVILLLLVVGFTKLASDYKSFLLPFLLKAAATIQKFK